MFVIWPARVIVEAINVPSDIVARWLALDAVQYYC